MLPLIDSNPYDYKKDINREDLFIEVGERLEIELQKNNVTVEQLALWIGKTVGDVCKIINGDLDLKLHEVADIFTCFDKVVTVIPNGNENIKNLFLYRDEVRITQNIDSALSVHKSYQVSGFQKEIVKEKLEVLLEVLYVYRPNEWV